jgi:hypothetical protein
MNIKFSRNKNFHPEIYYFKLITPDGKDISSGFFLQNPEEIKQRNADICLSEKFKEYIRNLPNE